MTIAAVYLSSEGVVLGADSTASNQFTGFHYFNHNQKLFEVGEGSTVGVLTWGLGSLGTVSYRTLIAELADDLANNPPADLQGVATRWRDRFWGEYVGVLGTYIQRCKALETKPAYDPAGPVDPNARTDAEEKEFTALRNNLVVGFCVAGYWPAASRRTNAFEVIFDPLKGQPTPRDIGATGSPYSFWGAPNFMKRLIFGADDSLKQNILQSGNWNAAPAELDAIFEKEKLGHAILPIRDAVDFVHTCIYSTIKALKFSNFNQICGGPIELAVISTDRKFRWVRHKAWDAAILEGSL